MKRIFSLLLLSLSLIGIFVYAYVGFTAVNGGYKIMPSYSGVYRSTPLTCSTVLNDGIGKTFFVPTHSSVEMTAFETHTPPDITIFSDDQPQCGTDLSTQCMYGDVVWISAPIGYDCGPGNIDRCYDWNCQSTCGSTDPCGFVDEGMGSACFVAGTQIALADGSYKSIENVVVGDDLIGMSNNTNIVQKLYQKYYTRRLYSINGSDYFVTDNHPFMTTEGWKSFAPSITMLDHPDLSVSMLEIGDIMITEQGPVRVVSTDSQSSSGYVYTFETDGNHTYYAHGFLVHNGSLPQ